MSATSSIPHAIRFDDRAIGITFSPDAPIEPHTFALHAESLACGLAQVTAVARATVEDLNADDPVEVRKLNGLLVCAEVMASLIESVALELVEEISERDRRKGGKSGGGQ